MDKNKLIEWLNSEKYIYTNDRGFYAAYGEDKFTTEEFEKEHQWEISRNRMIEKTIRYISEEL